MKRYVYRRPSFVPWIQKIRRIFVPAGTTIPVIPDSIGSVDFEGQVIPVVAMDTEAFEVVSMGSKIFETVSMASEILSVVKMDAEIKPIVSMTAEAL